MASILVKVVADLTVEDIREAMTMGYRREAKHLLHDLDDTAKKWGRENDKMIKRHGGAVVTGSFSTIEVARTISEIRLKINELKYQLR